MARFMVEKLGAVVPKHILDRMERAPNPKAEGVSIAVRTIKALKKIEGVRGVHIMPIGWEEIVPDLVREAGLLPRPDPTPRGPLPRRDHRDSPKTYLHSPHCHPVLG